ncbi:hypothetical protein LINGRAHAP2_LOCUS1813, partial [Linum grandiflorum]
KQQPLATVGERSSSWNLSRRGAPLLLPSLASDGLRGDLARRREEEEGVRETKESREEGLTAATERDLQGGGACWSSDSVSEGYGSHTVVERTRDQWESNRGVSVSKIGRSKKFGGCRNSCRNLGLVANGEGARRRRRTKPSFSESNLHGLFCKF